MRKGGNGFRQQKEPSAKQSIKELQAAVQNLQMGLRIAQMVSQQQMQNVGRIDTDVQKVYGVTQNLDYRTRALLELLNTDSDKLNEIADRMRLDDFNKQSNEEDEKLGFTNDDAGEVGDNSIVILTSTTNSEPDAGIFRTKFHIKDAPLPTLVEKLKGLKVNDKFTDTVNGVEHEFTVVGLRLAPEKQETEQAEAVKLDVVQDNAEEAPAEENNKEE